jgi:hypothetical protein
MMSNQTTKWWDFDRSWTGWTINWLLLFPFFAAILAIAIGMTVCVAIQNAPYWWAVMLPLCALIYMAVHACIRHGNNWEVKDV